jgi:DNA repair protein RadA/Sms
VLGGGIIAGSAVLLAGDPGIGKSTLLLQMIDRMSSAGHRCLMASGEESVDQVALRAKRLSTASSNALLTATDSLEAVLAAARLHHPDVLVVDSIQTMADRRIDHSAGSVAQVRECAASLVRHAKSTGTAVVMVGHVTKDGMVAGPKTLEHVVDTVLYLEGDRTGELRLLRATKNRFGPCDETGVFVMGGAGLTGVDDPSAMLLEDRIAGISGSVVFPSLEGSRPMLVEVQALLAPTATGQPRRVATGVDPRRLAMLCGVLTKRAGLSIAAMDVFVAAAGGIAVREPAGDLALCIAVASAASDRPVHHGLAVFGEVGLGGEVRRSPGAERRIGELDRMGFTTAIVPRGVEYRPRAMDVVSVTDLSSALSTACRDSTT